MTAVFILSAMRSYTSLLSTMIGQHPELYGTPELNLSVADDLRGVLAFYRRRPHGLHGLYRTIAQLQFGVQTDDTIAAATAFVAERLDWSTSRMLDWIEDAVAPRRVLDKSPVTVRSVEMMERLLAMRPDAQFLHIVRQPAAVCRSIDALHVLLDTEAGTSLRDKVDAEQVWLRCNQNVRAFQAALPPGQCLTLQGEQILGDWDIYAPQLCDWLGISADASALAAMRQPELSPYAGIGPDSAKYGNDPNFLNQPAYTPRPIPIEEIEAGVDGRAFLPATKKLARELGYA